MHDLRGGGSGGGIYCFLVIPLGVRWDFLTHIHDDAFIIHTHYSEDKISFMYLEDKIFIHALDPLSCYVYSPSKISDINGY
jgi:hypothetical protein